MLRAPLERKGLIALAATEIVVGVLGIGWVFWLRLSGGPIRMAPVGEAVLISLFAVVAILGPVAALKSIRRLKRIESGTDQAQR
jgi:hypothetical protein